MLITAGRKAVNHHDLSPLTPRLFCLLSGRLRSNIKTNEFSSTSSKVKQKTYNQLNNDSCENKGRKTENESKATLIMLSAHCLEQKIWLP